MGRSPLAHTVVKPIAESRLVHTTIKAFSDSATGAVSDIAAAIIDSVLVCAGALPPAEDNGGSCPKIPLEAPGGVAAAT